jgi:hypothetical protein
MRTSWWVFVLLIDWLFTGGRGSMLVAVGLIGSPLLGWDQLLGPGFGVMALGLSAVAVAKARQALSRCGGLCCWRCRDWRWLCSLVAVLQRRSNTGAAAVPLARVLSLCLPVGVVVSAPFAGGLQVLLRCRGGDGLASCCSVCRRLMGAVALSRWRWPGSLLLRLQEA